MSDALLNALLGIVGSLAVAAIIGAIAAWKDIAVLKRDVDALADIVGTQRAKARRPKGR